MSKRVGCLTVGALLGASLISYAAPQARAATVRAAAVNLTTVWSHTLNDAGAATTVVYSSPMVATLDAGGPAALLGDGTGHVYAFHLGNGSSVPGWPASTGAPVQSTPSISGTTVYVGSGDARQPNVGGYEAFNASGRPIWMRTINAIYGQATPLSGVQASMAVGNLQGQTDVVAGSLGQMQDAINAGTGAVLRGFPIFQADTNFSTPAIADLYQTGQNEVVEGGEVSTGLAFGIQYHNGGLFRILSPTGGTTCQVNLDQAIDSSPAVGRILGGGAVGITFGTGNTFAGASTTDMLFGYTNHCGRVWGDRLDGLTASSPALIDALGNGALEIAEGTDTGSAGTIYLINGANGAVINHTGAIGRVVGGIVSADLGGGYQDLVVPTTNGLQIVDGRSFATVATLRGFSMQNSPLVTKDPNGTIGITVAGIIGTNAQGFVDHVEVVGSPGSRVSERGGWPTFHHDAHLTGNAGTPPPAPCVAPTTARGYWMTGSDGNLYRFGNLPYCGSTGNVLLNRPIVTMAGTHDAGGYWLVATDGGIFNFGDAHYYGSTGAVHLNKPIVGMAPTHDGKGYWLVASDGGIFSFGDAHFYGSTGGITLNKPIVGMAATPDGRGYWMVASDGGIFSFGDARFYGSTGGITLNKPIVGMAATPDGRGYWMVARDGGIFTFGDAHYHGSTGGITLARPIIGMATFPPTGGYWLMASDGGVFGFDAPYYGSLGGAALPQPVVAVAGY